ncbi:hypothetical protein [Methylocystis bryophila]|uniref:Uncharacterized protein n=1 Tax=Methylocystis bryophila TaxID=655015 RepID=A0A1W6MSD0_9HYPH|nr:hypothetical protein [Methylocystis bryophila]ARN80508.1 hypothetical protein B1812_04865 [Methylocystis bryophila]BDV40544.1 hypothetical protein DSM21852_37970 [Methylocystis bryophila]
MTVFALSSPASRSTLSIGALAVFSLLFTLGFACAVPLAAFAAISAISFDRRNALVATGAVWLANQAIGFGFMHYPLEGETLAWGGALGVIALLSCEAARLASRRLTGVAGAVAAFLAAFVAYEGSLLLIDAAIGLLERVDALGTLRIFLINACAFGGFWALKTIASSTSVGRKLTAGLSARHA